MNDKDKEFEKPIAELVFLEGDVIATSEFSDPNLDPNGWN